MRETFLGLGPEWWSVIGTFITGVAAAFIALIVFLYTRKKDSVSVTNYKIRISWLVIELQAYLLLGIASLQKEQDINYLKSVSATIVRICEKVESHIDMIVDKFDPQLLADLLRTTDWIKSLFENIETQEVVFPKNDKPLGSLVFKLREKADDLYQYYRKLNVGTYVFKDSEIFGDALQKAEKKV